MSGRVTSRFEFVIRRPGLKDVHLSADSLEDCKLWMNHIALSPINIKPQGKTVSRTPWLPLSILLLGSGPKGDDVL